MANQLSNYKEFLNIARKYLEENKDELFNVIDYDDYLLGYYDLPEDFLKKNDKDGILLGALENVYVLEKYINKGTIII